MEREREDNEEGEGEDSVKQGRVLTEKKGGRESDQRCIWKSDFRRIFHPFTPMSLDSDPTRHFIGWSILPPVYFKRFPFLFFLVLCVKRISRTMLKYDSPK